MKKDNCNIGLDEKVLQAIEEMKVELGEHFSLEKLNLAELGRRTGISRKKLRRLKKNGFSGNPHGAKGRSSSMAWSTFSSGPILQLSFFIPCPFSEPLARFSIKAHG